MTVTIIKNVQLHVTSEEFVDMDSVAIMDHRIVPVTDAILEDGSAEEIDGGGCHLCPGFIDLLVNGCGGVSFAQTPSVDTLDTMRRWLIAHGTTVFVPTMISGPRENLSKGLAAVAEFKEKHPTMCPGMHMEGPFISTNHPGFQPTGYIRSFAPQDLEFLAEFRDAIAYMTIAPEIVRPKGIMDLLALHIRLSLGHTAIGYHEAMQSFKAGINNVTHLFNGMKPIIGREPGLAGATLQSEKAFASIIADGRHVHPTLIQLAYKMLGDRFYIVSDAQAVAGMSKLPASFVLGGTEIFVDHKRGLIDGKGAYAGTAMSMFDGVRYLVQHCGFDLEDALTAATYTPARVLGLNEHGRIEGGFIADLVIFDDDFKIVRVFQNGYMKQSIELF